MKPEFKEIIEKVKELREKEVENQQLTIISKSGWCYRCGWINWRWGCGWTYCMWAPKEGGISLEEMKATLTSEEKELLRKFKE